ncbi:hypothetical protein ANCCEY_10707 [Ancylostoma ceylanicum]|uniref:Tc1-like transposase DDE domain-containing protein n=1 Tax=Ancylostoma ceylanicum TaxID=53326 RepID=A0A0D6LJP2_9BILA|nr:hypothetical protein ANCCEY_10707 [Ancylostoma ceylanicum]
MSSQRRGNDFSSIARRLLLSRESRHDYSVGAYVEIRDSPADEEVRDCAANVEIRDSPADEEVRDCAANVEIRDSAADEEIRDSAADTEIRDSANETTEITNHRVVECMDVADTANVEAEVSNDDAPTDGAYIPVNADPPAVGRACYGQKAKVIVKRVRQFFEQLKLHLGSEAKGTIFNNTAEITALACGVSVRTVTNVGKRNDFVHDLIPRAAKIPHHGRKLLRETTVRRHGEKWGEIVRHLIHDKLKQEVHVTVEDLQMELHELYPSFNLSCSTLRRLMHGLGFSYRINKGQPYIFERLDIVRKRELYLRNIANARSQGHCLVFMDETWVFESMTTKRGWNDNNISRFAPEAVLQEYSALNDFIASRGGVAALRRYATEAICAEYGVNVIRLPPFHCFFNPIELCWSQLKDHLTKMGKPSDALQLLLYAEQRGRWKKTKKQPSQYRM